MAIYKRKLRSGNSSKYFWTKFQFRGTRIQKSTGCTSLRKAEAFEADLKSQLNHDRIGIDILAERGPKRISMAAAIEAYLEESAKVKRVSTHKRHKTASVPVLKFLGRVADVSKVTRKEVEGYIDWRRTQKKKAPARKLAIDPRAKSDKVLAPATVNRELEFISGVFSHLIKNGAIAKNPASGVSKLAEDNLQERVVEKHEYSAYIMAASQPLRDIAVIIYESGMRPSEVMHLRKADIDFVGGKIRIQKGKTKAARRKLVMTPPIRSIMEKRWKNTETDLLFAGGRKGQHTGLASGASPVEKVTNAHHGALARSGVAPFRLYDLRHTFATEFVAAGGDIVALAAILGHSKLDQVTRYAHPTELHQATAIEKLQRYREGFWSNVAKLKVAAG